MEEAKKAVDTTKLITTGKESSGHLQTLLQHLQSHLDNQPDGRFPAEFPDGALAKLEQAGIAVATLAQDCHDLVEQTNLPEHVTLEKDLTAQVEKLLVYITPCLEREVGYMKAWADEQWTGTMCCLAAVGESGTALDSIRDLGARLAVLSRTLSIHGGTPRSPIFFFASLAEEARLFQEGLEALENGQERQEEGFLTHCIEFSDRVAKVQKRHPLYLEEPEGALFKQLHDSWARASDRFDAIMDNMGLAWIKSYMSGNPGESARERLKEVMKTSEFVIAPTQFLQECFDTCDLAFQQPPAADVSNWGDLASTFPVFVKARSINQELMKQISPESLSSYESFCPRTTEKLAEFSQSFQQCIAQLGKLHAKYEPLANIFAGLVPVAI